MMHSSTHHVALCGLALTLSAFGAGDPPAAEPSAAPAPAPAQTPATEAKRPSPASVLARLRDRYSRARTYRDIGTSESKFSSQTTLLKFSTVFDRNAGCRWRFVSNDESNAYEVWSVDQKAWNSWWGLTKELEHFDTFDSAIAGPTGISSGTVRVVPVILVRGAQRCSLLQNLRTRPQVERETLDGVECDVVSGSSRDRQVRLWIDDQGALRQYTESYDVDPAAFQKELPNDDPMKGRKMEKFHVDQTVRYQPVFDAPVKPEDTTFTPDKR